jgi:adenylate kinase
MGSLLLISAPGAGKGVVSKYLSEKYNYKHMSIGNLLRDEAKNDKSINEILKKGEFVDSNIVNSLLENFVKNNINENIVFEGFPRLIEQIKDFDNILNKYNINIDKVILVDIDKEIAEKRITGRLMCPNCNEIYNKYFDKIIDNKCKKCNSDLSKRNDDKISTYEIRYKTFIEKTYPVVDYYKNKGILFTISNNGSISDTYSQIDNLMDKSNL